MVLVVFGPEKLPELARNFGKIMGEFRKATGDLRSTFEGHLRDLERGDRLSALPDEKAANPAVMTPLPQPGAPRLMPFRRRQRPATRISVPAGRNVAAKAPNSVRRKRSNCLIPGPIAEETAPSETKPLPVMKRSLQKTLQPVSDLDAQSRDS